MNWPVFSMRLILFFLLIFLVFYFERKLPDKKSLLEKINTLIIALVALAPEIVKDFEYHILKRQSNFNNYNEHFWLKIIIIFILFLLLFAILKIVPLDKAEKYFKFIGVFLAFLILSADIIVFFLVKIFNI